MPDQMRSYLDFEKPVAELDSKVDELRGLAASGSDIGEEILRLEDKAGQAIAELYANLTPWQKTLVARHPQRPHFTDFVNGLISEFTPLAGDRKFGEDEALLGGFGRFRGESICGILYLHPRGGPLWPHFLAYQLGPELSLPAFRRNGR
jgi:acetyl-CoA carboxylase carboxyl transferase subunit alpha